MWGGIGASDQMQRLSQNTQHFHALKRIGNKMNVRGGEVTQIC